MKHPSAETKNLVDVALTYGAIMLIQWGLVPLTFCGNTVWLPVVVLCAILILIHVAWFSPVCIHGDPASLHGIGSWRRGFLRSEYAEQSFRYFGGITLACLTLLFLGIGLLFPEYLKGIRWSGVVFKFLSYLVPALLQAVLVFECLLPRCMGFMSRPKAVLLVAALFSLLHAPNHLLMAFCIVIGILWGWEYARRPNLIPLVLAHSILGTCLNQILHLNLRVGPFYLHPNEFLIRRLLPWWGDLAGRLL